ncbi:MAG: hypothetical protein IJJ38_05130 [Lachnospiraceae bacterium]|nr:hypothetical protein [Lachnospiraceae bacterium]
MKNRIKRKIGSRSGASITFALLLFLVCSIVCSVVLAAATAASGRMSRIAEDDGRYYAVMSAAELIRDQFRVTPSEGGPEEDMAVSLVKRTESVSVTHFTDDAGGEPEPQEDETAEKTYLLKKRAADITEEDFRPENQISGDGAAGAGLLSDSLAGALVQHLAEHPGEAGEETLTLAVRADGGADPDMDTLAAQVTEKIDADGNLEFVIRNTDGDPYQVIVTFGLTLQTNTDTKSKDGPKINVADEGGRLTYDVETVTTVTETKTYVWKPTGMRTVQAAPAETPAP